MAWTTPKTWAIGDVLTASDMNTYVRDNISDRPRCRLVRDSTSQSINSGAVTDVSWESASIDNASMWSAGSPTRITIPASGDYLVGARIFYSAHADGSWRAATIKKNGTDTLAYVQAQPDAASSAQGIGITAVDLVTLAAGDYIVAQAYHGAGVAVNVLGGDDQYCAFWAVLEGV